MNYAKKISEDATNCYIKIKDLVEKISKNDKIAIQIVRNISSIKNYRDKIREYE